LSSLQGQWVFLNFWATWCPPCKQEMPTFQGLLDGKFGTPLKFTVLAVDNAESVDVVQSYLDGLNLKIPVVLDSERDAARLYGIVQMPMTFIIDPAGVVRAEHLGEMTPDYLKEYLRRMVSGKLS
jgi:cytochrome c biogenesis protein CcmG, thiol:disulfide interchange protein DsbE